MEVRGVEGYTLYTNSIAAKTINFYSSFHHLIISSSIILQQSQACSFSTANREWNGNTNHSIDNA